MNSSADIVVRWDKSQCVVAFMLSAAMTLCFGGGAAYCISKPPPAGIIAASLLFIFCLLLAALTAMTWRQLKSDRAAVVINETGIRTVSMQPRQFHLNWSDVAEIVLMEPSLIRRTPRVLFIVTTDPSTVHASLSLARRAHRRFSWRYLGVKFAIIIPEGLDIPLDELAVDIAAISGAPLRHK